MVHLVEPKQSGVLEVEAHLCAMGWRAWAARAGTAARAHAPGLPIAAAPAGPAIGPAAYRTLVHQRWQRQQHMHGDIRLHTSMRCVKS